MAEVNLNESQSLEVQQESPLALSTFGSNMPSQYFFNVNSKCYENERLMFDKLTTEAYESYGSKCDYFVVSYSLDNERVFGEDNDRHITAVFPVKMYFELPPEDRKYTQWGMEEEDTFVMWISKTQFTKYASVYSPDYKPHEGDLIRPHYNGIIYEIRNIVDTDNQFLNTQHTYKLTVAVWTNDMKTADENDYNGADENLHTYDETNGISTQPPESLTSIREYVTSGSDFLKQNEIIDEMKDDVLYNDPKNPNYDPFNGW